MRSCTLIADRQKLIKIADRSDFGWEVVEEYEEDELAENSGDEKRLAKAEKAAERKVSKRKTAAKQRRQRWPPPPARSPQLNAAQLGAGSPPIPLLPKMPGLPVRKVGPCFSCGAFGHLRANCNASRGDNRPGRQNSYPSMHADVCSLSGGRALGEEEAAGKDTVQSVGDACGDMLHDPTVEIGLARCHQRDWECEQLGASHPDKVSVKGRLRSHQEFWEEELEASPFALGMVKRGYVLPLKSQPPPYSRANQQSARDNTQFVTEAVLELLEKGCIKECSQKPHGCHPLAVVSSASGKLRLVLNLRHLNKFLWTDKFKYEDLKVAMQYFKKGDYLFTFDLKSGYHHVDIIEEHWQYLGFQWECDGVTHYYVFCVLPFGLSTACYAFTKLLRPLVKYWRAQGLRITVYLDDGICVAQGLEAANRASEVVKCTLDRAGFVVNVAKSMLQPAQQGQWLGFQLDLALGELSVPSQKIEALKSLLAQAVKAVDLPARQIASIIGKIISMSPALGPVARLMTRSLYGLLDTMSYWSDRLFLTPFALQELQFWLYEIESYNNQPIWQNPSAVRVVFSDASDTGFGGYTVECAGVQVAHGLWSPEEQVTSSTMRELMAVTIVLRSLLPLLGGHNVRWFTDNQNVAHILQVGSRKPDLQEQALIAASYCYPPRMDPQRVEPAGRLHKSFS